MNQKDEFESPRNILIVDDLPESLQLLSCLLIKHGYKVTCVTDGQVALHIIKAELPDLVLLDILLPTIDGYQVCQILKSQEYTRHIPVIFLSNLDSEIDKVRAFKVGAVDYITKPFFIEEIIARIQKHLEILSKNQQLQRIVQLQLEERRVAEKELECSRSLLSGVLDSSLDGVAAFEAIRDVQGEIVDFKWLLANPVAVMTVGQTKENLIGKHLFAEESSSLFEGLLDSFVLVVEKCTVLNKEYYYSCSTFAAWFQIVAVKLGDGFAMTFRDISDRKQIEIALETANIELRSQANYDSLTKIYNRRRFDKYIFNEWSRCAREGKYLSLILCDIDYFKAYNDTFGHQLGDRCLYQVAQAIAKGVRRPGDLAFRYGGEEFTIVLPLTDKIGALKVAEKIRQNVEQLKISHQSSPISQFVTLSLGVSSMIPSPEAEYQLLIAAADRALYRAKAGGRNRAFFNQDIINFS
ncbi:diguanylate cyclase domain-containing protein [Myxosarcina sp. GI1(2024)]